MFSPCGYHLDSPLSLIYNGGVSLVVCSSSACSTFFASSDELKYHYLILEKPQHSTSDMGPFNHFEDERDG